MASTGISSHRGMDFQQFQAQSRAAARSEFLLRQSPQDVVMATSGQSARQLMARHKEIQLYGKGGVFYFNADLLPPGTITEDTPLPFTRQR